VMGTAEYMAPEQARSADMVDPRADLYAVGVMLYEMIAGARPVRGDTGEDARVIALKVERGEVIPLVQAAPDVPRDLAGLVHHAMAARPDMRFSTATEMRLALEGAMAGKRPSTKALAQAPSGTVAMGAPPPVRTAASPAITGANLEEPHIDTVRAPPIPTAMAAPAYVNTGIPAMAPGEHVSPRRRVPVGALIGLSLLLGASVLAILVGTGTIALSSGPPSPPATVTPAAIPTPTPTTPAPPATPAATTAAPATPAIPTLAPTRPVPTAPRPAPSNRPAPEADAGAPQPPPFVLPTAFPSTLPPFPSVFPFPAGFPSTLPSGFPSIPGWPIPSPQPPAKQAAPTGSAGY